MQLKNTKENFGFIAKFFHWSVGILVLLLLSVGFYMTGLEMSPFKLNIYLLHKSFGILVLILVIGRAAWRFISPRPDPLPTHKKWEDTLAKIVHFGLYVCLILMPLSGWVMSSAGGFPATFFGLFSLPAVVEKNDQLFLLTREAHELIAYTILGLLALHFAGAFKHHFIDKDETLKRMTSTKVGFWWGLLFVAIAGFFWTKPIMLAVQLEEKAPVAADAASTEIVPKADAPVEEAQQEGWIIDPINSSIKFEASQYGEAFAGEFKKFGGKIIFDPGKLDEAYADIWIDITSIRTGSDDRDVQARSADWFDTENFPQAQFVADSFSETGANQYVAHGALTIRGKAVVVDLPFTLQIRESPKGQAALMEGAIALNRLDFGIGQGQWQATDAIANAVKINITVLADSP